MLSLQTNAPPINSVRNAFDAGDGAQAEKIEHVGPVIGRLVTEQESCSAPGVVGRNQASQGAGRASVKQTERLVEAPQTAEAGGEAISAIGRDVSWINCLASNTRRVCATATGEAPRCWRNSRRNCLSPTPSRSASGRRSASSSAPISIIASARDTVLEVPRQAPRSGAVSGRQRRQGRNPASCAAAAVGKKRTFSSGRARRANRTAIDSGRQDRREQTAVETGIARANRAVAGVVIEVHGASLRFQAPPRLAVFGLVQRHSRPIPPDKAF